METRSQTVRKLAQTALLAALCFVSFTFLQIKIPMPGGDATSLHIGNAFCVLAALLLGGVYGGIAGAVGMSIADILDPVYIVGAPKTFVLKMCIGLIVGLVAHRVAKINECDCVRCRSGIQCDCGSGGRLFLQTVYSGTAAADGRDTGKMERSDDVCQCGGVYASGSGGIQCASSGSFEKRAAGDGQESGGTYRIGKNRREKRLLQNGCILQ